MDPPRSEPSRDRLASVDLLRGLAMVLMAVDHLRDYLSGAGVPPEDVDHASAALFLTRFVTHLCAPAFFFLAGAGAFLSTARDKPLAQLSRFLVTRGLWLILLECTVTRLGWTFSLHFLGPRSAGVLWALGGSMILLAALVHLGPRWVGLVGLSLVAGHHLLEPITFAPGSALAGLWSILWVPGFVKNTTGHLAFWPGIRVLYPLVPWMGVMACGYGFGEVLRTPAGRRRKILFALGGGLVLLFLILRATNLYGNAAPLAGLRPGDSFASGPFRARETIGRTLMAFVNVQKYPPSLQFVLMTIGLGIVLLAVFEGVDLRGAAGRHLARLELFGRVPLFYYLLHLYVVHALALLLALATGQPARWLWQGAFLAQSPPPGYGQGLRVLWLTWGASIVLLYFPCRWFASLKARRKDWGWLRYL